MDNTYRGEPSLWIDSEFVSMLKRVTGKRVAIETNGSREVPDEIDWVTVSPKTGMSGAGEYEMRVSRADEPESGGCRSGFGAVFQPSIRDSGYGDVSSALLCGG